MTNYSESLGTARRSFQILESWLSGTFCDEGKYVLSEKGRLSAEIQQKYGDLVAQRNGEMVWIELKAEEKFTGNFFIEDWSNWSRGNPGWVHKLETDLLFYHFLDVDRLYLMDFIELRRWLFRCDRYNGRNRMSFYPLVRQTKCDQLNDTWGRLVKIDDVMATDSVRTHIVYLGGDEQRNAEPEKIQTELFEFEGAA